MDLYSTSAEMLSALTIVFNTLPTSYYNMSEIILSDTPIVMEEVKDERLTGYPSVLGEYLGFRHCQEGDLGCRSSVVIHPHFRYGIKNGEIYEIKNTAPFVANTCIHESGHSVCIELHKEDQSFFLWGDYDQYPVITNLQHAMSHEREACAEAFATYWTGHCATKTNALKDIDKKLIRAYIEVYYVLKDNKNYTRAYEYLTRVMEKRNLVYEAKCMMIEKFSEIDLDPQEVIELRKRQEELKNLGVI